jgi:predicted amidohydrolase YtcJ
MSESQVLYYNGIIYNNASNELHYQFMIVDRDGVIVKCGSEDPSSIISSWPGEKYDLEGKYVLPGLQDSHIHTFLLGTSQHTSFNLQDLQLHS